MFIPYNLTEQELLGSFKVTFADILFLLSAFNYLCCFNLCCVVKAKTVLHIVDNKVPNFITTAFAFCPQAVFSSIFYFASVPLYQGFLMVGYVTFPVQLTCYCLCLMPVAPWQSHKSTKQMCRYTKLHFWTISVLCRYATIYTMFPVFSLVLDQDVKPEMALLYPELYKDLTKVQCPFRKDSFIKTTFYTNVLP